MSDRVPLVKALTLAALMSIATPAVAQVDLPCPPRWGEPGRALVSTAETAKAVFLAVETDFFPQADRVGFPDVVAEDEGEWWTVFRHRQPEQRPDGSAMITLGGGQLSIRIAKCDATITEVWFSR